jgi:hypothetical protein
MKNYSNIDNSVYFFINWNRNYELFVIVGHDLNSLIWFFKITFQLQDLIWYSPTRHLIFCWSDLMLKSDQKIWYEFDRYIGQTPSKNLHIPRSKILIREYGGFWSEFDQYTDRTAYQIPNTFQILISNTYQFPISLSGREPTMLFLYHWSHWYELQVCLWWISPLDPKSHLMAEFHSNCRFFVLRPSWYVVGPASETQQF